MRSRVAAGSRFWIAFQRSIDQEHVINFPLTLLIHPCKRIVILVGISRDRGAIMRVFLFF